jgi:hypothetical protein
MRQLLDFLHFGKREDSKKAKADTERPKKFDPASTLIIAGEAVPRGELSQPGHDKQADAAADEDAKQPGLAEVVSARRRDRWQAPELDGPEFGGLIERRGVDTRGLMPQKYTSESTDEHRKETEAKPLAKSPSQPQPGAIEEQSLESTGMFLAELDNSAITLADSGLFRVADDEEEAPASDGSINPYNHGS